MAQNNALPHIGIIDDAIGSVAAWDQYVVANHGAIAALHATFGDLAQYVTVDVINDNIQSGILVARKQYIKLVVLNGFQQHQPRDLIMTALNPNSVCVGPFKSCRTWARGIVAMVALCQDAVNNNAALTGQRRASCIRIVTQLRPDKLRELISYIVANNRINIPYAKPIGPQIDGQPNAIAARAPPVNVSVPVECNVMAIRTWCTSLWTNDEWSANGQAGQ